MFSRSYEIRTRIVVIKTMFTSPKNVPVLCVCVCVKIQRTRSAMCAAMRLVYVRVRSNDDRRIGV